jgi:hypothetical protein
MNISWRILTGTALALAFSSFATADTVTTTSTLSSASLDITDTALSITPFTPGSNGVPLGSILTGFTVTFADAVSGTVTFTNTGASTASYNATPDTLGLLYLFTSAASHGDTPIDPLNPPSDDAFAGSDPDASASKISAKNLAKGGSYTSPTYTSSGSATSALDSTAGDLTLVQSAWDVYISTATTLNANLGGVGTVSNNATVSGTVSVTYDYSTSPEPATLVLFGSALVGLGLIRKRLTK